MNIFALDIDPKTASRYHVDRHVVKMINESAQMLSNAANLVTGRLKIIGGKLRLDKTVGHLEHLPKPTHWHHKCSRWVFKSRSNAYWLLELFNALCCEYTHRYNKTHAYSSLRFDKYLKHLPDGELMPFALAIPEPLQLDQYDIDQAIHQYRLTYLTSKYHLWSWSNTEIPQWIIDMAMPDHDLLVKIFQSRS